MAGCFVGRLRLTGELSAAQYEASVKWLEDCRNNSIARQARTLGAIDLNATKGGSGDYENVARARQHVASYEAARKAVQAKQDELRGMVALFAALQYCVTEDLELMHMLGDLRVALNALARHYRLNERVAA